MTSFKDFKATEQKLKSVLGISSTTLMACLHNLERMNLIHSYHDNSLNDEKFNLLAEEVDSFINKIKLKYGENHLENNRVFKLNVQTYPVTEKIPTHSEENQSILMPTGDSL